jgi:hypothetical protein
MAKRRPKYPEKPWKPDPVKWKKLLDKKLESGTFRPPLQPKGGWQLWDWISFEDKPQNENGSKQQHR